MFPFSHEEENRRKDGTTFPVEVRMGSVDYGGRRFILSSVRDITERKAFEAQLTYQALHDSLTGLPNRTLFLDRLEHALARTGRRQAATVAVLFMDLDDFKNVNDSLGHEVGDELLRAVGARLKEHLRPGDTAARLGGDEFAILLEDVRGVEDAAWVAQRIIEKLRAPFAVMGHEIFFTTSIGISLSTSEKVRAEEVLRDADLAMYQAKEKGKGGYQVYDSAMYDRVLKRLSLERDLRRAISQDEFVVHYQPKVLLETGRIVGVEALIRWENPEQGLTLPGEFVSMAEELRLIVPVGRGVLEEACRQASEWRERYPEDLLQMVSVNLSASQLQHPDLLREVSEILQRTELDPRSLTLEITESVVMSDAPSNIATLLELRHLGLEMAIDDFGTGYSSLSYLKRFPVSFLKIDRSFVEGLREGSDDAVVVSGIVALAHTLGMRTIAEGVETVEQLRILRQIGCDMAQGHYFSPPLAPDAASELLAADPRW
jgi:diguanylate cyclase (GGDEF)-like protein